MKLRYLFIILLFILSGSFTDAQTLNLATYNLRNDNNKEDSLNGNGWKQRYPVIAGLIRFHDFDIFGTQEGLTHQLTDLTGEMPEYAYIGIGRDDGKTAGEYSAIFYKKDKFRLLKKGDFWLSEITDRPNKGWDAVLPRICSWGEFQLTGTDFKFYFFNIHYDHIGVIARKESARLILRKVKELAGNMPAVLTGDFNVDQNDESYAVINNSGILKDSYDLSPFRYATNGTFNAFKTDAKTDSRIDHIFLTAGFSVKRYGILTDTYRSERSGKTTDSSGFPKEVSLKQYEARVPSDHFPVMITVSY